MTVDGHPAELDLLAYAEGDLPRGAARDLEAHLAACPECAAAVEAQRAMRALLRGEPLLSLDADEVREVVRALPPQPQPEPLPAPWWRRRPAGRRLLVLAPAGGLAVAAAVAAVVVALPGGGGPAPTALDAAATTAVAESAAGSSAAASSAAASDATALKGPATMEAAPAAGDSAPAGSDPAGARSAPVPLEGTATAAYGSAGTVPGVAGLPLLRAVAGTPEEIAERLRDAGLEAAVEDGAVVVRGADGERAREVLAAVPAGPVRVVTR